MGSRAPTAKAKILNQSLLMQKNALDQILFLRQCAASRMERKRGPECLGVRASWPPVVASVMINERPPPAASDGVIDAPCARGQSVGVRWAVDALLCCVLRIDLPGVRRGDATSALRALAHWGVRLVRRSSVNEGGSSIPKDVKD
jgi:hypothetical protein